MVNTRNKDYTNINTDANACARTSIRYIFDEAYAA